MLDTERDLICFSHLRWGFVFQRPQHLMARFARRRRVFFFEEPIFEGDAATIRKTTCEQTGVHIITPVLPVRANGSTNQLTREVLNSFLKTEQISSYVAWFYTPMALEFASHLNPAAVVYDCMDELSMFKGAPPELHENERQLFRLADLVFTGGASLFEAKQGQHARVHLFPSSVDVTHFSKARAGDHSPEDQRNIPHPRIGYAGVIDERMDLDLLRGIAPAVSRMAVHHGRTRRQDRPRQPAQRAEHSLLWDEAVPEPACVFLGLGRGDAALRHQRFHPVHQPDQNT